MNPQRVGASVFLALGLSVLTLGVVIAGRERAYRQRARPVQGTVLLVNEGRRPDGEVFYVATVQWLASDDVPRTYRAYPQRMGDLNPGDRLDLRYDPTDLRADPRSAGAAGDGFLFGVLGAIGVVFTAARREGDVAATAGRLDG